MDVIKMEPEDDPLAIKDEADPSPLEGTAVESTDSGCGFKWEVKLEETAASVTFSAVKFEPEEQTFDVAMVKQENQTEVTTEESELLTQSESHVARHYVKH
ncbi:uncharacterized protein [Periplaneta americana]|uniref:uncharacterized protein isoform X4 n=1 Tax=Periplaneta americana TaxID=6978 RepID=UPI0037E77FB0